jgi:hypothetical protein
MRIHLNQGHLFVFRQGAHDRDGDTVIPAQRDQRRAGGEYLARRHLRPPVVRMGVELVGGHIAAIHDLDRTVVKQWTAEIPVEMKTGSGFLPSGVLGVVTNGLGRPALIIRQVIDDVWQAEGDPQNGDIGVKIVQIEGQGKTQKTVG